MSRYYGGWAPYVPVAERRRNAERAVAKLRQRGHPVAPVTIAGRLIATTFWGRAWCDNMESYHDYESRLPRGRTYVRNGSVVDLQIAPGRVTAMVSGSELYDVCITIKETSKAQWRRICTDCTGRIDSVVELLQGRFSNGVMERLCRQQGGLFPHPSEIRFSCSCPDHALMCKHVAAVLYGVGARLDHQPELLFRLRGVNEKELVASIDTALPIPDQGPATGRILGTEDVSALFGLDMAAAEAPVAPQGTGRSRKARDNSTAAVAADQVPPVARPRAAKAGLSASVAPDAGSRHPPVSAHVSKAKAARTLPSRTDASALPSPQPPPRHTPARSPAPKPGIVITRAFVEAVILQQQTATAGASPAASPGQASSGKQKRVSGPKVKTTRPKAMPRPAQRTK
ncbi:SWIM-type domain-containing protein (plasmid) [Rhodovastum atsumiense]|uniref:SWIM zinc finger family protein n=1 Tax=Rhodovastum atsumiense TaxID=504468 RepID=UPI0020245161|nr:SWIM zinc finger family protein [Rhodovastum atsumiense]CAH2605473.1 SWIM-type domain-containing protein [Rhodovastum atsumiense]